MVDSPVRKIKIAFIVNDLGLGGVQRLTVDFANYIDKERFDVTIATLFSRTDSFFYREKIGEGVRFVPFSFKNWSDIVSIVSLYKWLRREKFHIVFTQLFMADTIGRVAAWCALVPVIVTEIQNIIPNISKKYIIVDRALRYITDTCISTTDAVTEYAKKVIGFPDEKISFVPTNAVDGKRFEVVVDRKKVRSEIGVPIDSKLIITVGRLVEQKGQRVLISAMQEVIKVESRAHLVIAGSGKLKDELQEQIDKLGLSDRVKLLGDRTDVPELLMSSDVFAFPSLWEGQGLILFEAFFSKIPVVASRVGGIPDVIRDRETGLLVPPDDPRALAGGILEMLHKSELRKKVVAEALRRYGDRTIKESVKKLEALFQSLYKNNMVS